MRLPTNQPSEKHAIIKQLNGPVTLWSLRILLRLNLRDRFLNHHDLLSNAEILQPIGLMEHYNPDLYDQKAKKKEVIKKLDQQLDSMEKQPLPNNDPLTQNIQLLSQSLPLTATEKELLQLSVSSYQNNGFGYLMDLIGELNNQQSQQILAVILGKNVEQINQALNINSTLLSSGLLRLHSSYGHQELLRQRLILPEAIFAALSKPHRSQFSILSSFFKESPAARLKPSDYQHIENDYKLIQNYINTAVKNDLTGVNILIYGAPGTGKTEMVRTLCANEDLQLHEITMQQENGEPAHGPDRFSTLKLSQRLLAETHSSVLLFDEIEDVFPTLEPSFLGAPRTGDLKKAWVNNILEENKVPTFWLCNSTQQIDPSYLRRFDYVLKLRPLTNQVRLRILKKYLSALPVSERWLTQLAEQEHLVPAIVERAAKVASHLNRGTEREVEATLEKIIGNTLEVMGLPRNSCKKEAQNTQYKLDFLNPDTDLEALCESLKKANSACICLYGAPGTGKTAFGHYLAEQLGKTVLTKRASDILSKWVGEAEKNIAEMFEEATENDQILMLDEADSFLQERQSAHQSWEVTQVNELLVQMETFKGIFIASTNLMSRLDAASLRRFEFKIKFDYMSARQAWALFEQILIEQNSGQLTPSPAELSSIKAELGRLHTLTPGDFAAILRRTNSLGQCITAERLLSDLVKEQESKPNYSPSIGFFH